MWRSLIIACCTAGLTLTPALTQAAEPWTGAPPQGDGWVRTQGAPADVQLVHGPRGPYYGGRYPYPVRPHGNYRNFYYPGYRSYYPGNRYYYPTYPAYPAYGYSYYGPSYGYYGPGGGFSIQGPRGGGVSLWW